MTLLAGHALLCGRAVLPFAECLFQSDTLRAGYVVTGSAECRLLEKCVSGRNVRPVLARRRVIERTKHAAFEEFARLDGVADVCLIIRSGHAVADDAGHAFHRQPGPIDVSPRAVFP